MHKNFTKQMFSAVLVAAMLVTSQPLSVLASDLPDATIVCETEALLETEDVSVIPELSDDVAHDIPDLAVMQETLAEFSDDELSDVTPDDESSLSLQSSEADKKAALAATLSYFESAVDGVDYVSGEVIRLVESDDEAAKVATIYGANLVSCQMGVALFKLPDTMSVAKAIELAADPDSIYPQVSPNYYQNKSDTVDFSVDTPSDAASFNSFSDSFNIEVADNASFTSHIAEKSSLDPYLDESISVDVGGYKQYPYQWHHEVIGSPYAWANGITGAGVTIAMLDSGINSHEDITGTKIVNNYSCIPGRSTEYTDADGSGTFIAGLIAADINASEGIGIAPDANLINIRTDYNRTEPTTDMILEGFNYALTKKPDIITLGYNLSKPLPEYEVLCNQAYEAGIAVFASMPSTGGSMDSWPAACKHAIAVSGCDKNNMIAGFASYSPNTDFAVPAIEIWGCNYKSLTEAPQERYVAMSGAALTSAFAAAEAALIISDWQNIPALKDRNGNKKTGPAMVDALIKHMKASTIKAGKGTGSGIVYLPKALKLGTMLTAPIQPEIILNIENANELSIEIKPNDYLTEDILFTINGKKPSVKNGVRDNYSYTYSGKMTIPLDDINTEYVTVNALSVNAAGLASKVTTSKISLAKSVSKITLSGPDRVIAGKSTKLNATILPLNPKNKSLEWHVAVGTDEALAASNGASCVNGVFKASSTCVPGTYTVWAKSKLSDVKSPAMNVVVLPGALIKSISAKAPVQSFTLTDVLSKTVDLNNYFNVERIDGTPVQEKDVYYTSSNPKIASAENGNTLTVNAPGKVKITALANDGSGIKATGTLTISRNAVSIHVYSNSYGKVAAGKSIKCIADITPYDASNKKVEWLLDDPAINAGIKIKNGNVTTAKTTPAGVYYLKAQVTNSDGSVVNKISSFSVISNGITKITMDKTAQLLRTNTAYMTPGKQILVLNAKVEGGEISGGSLNTNSLAVDISQPSLLSYEGIAVRSDGTVDFAVGSTGEGTGKVNVTLRALDGSNCKAKCVVNVINPVSSVKVAPAKAGMNDAATIGKPFALKATLGNEYGLIGNKKVKWEVFPADKATISSSGVVTVNSNVDNGTVFGVIASAEDGGRAYGTYYFTAYKNVGKLAITDFNGKPVKPSGSCPVSYSTQFWIKVKRTGTNFYSFSDFNIDSSNASVGTAWLDAGSCWYDPTSGYEYYRINTRGIKKGSTKITVSTKDRSQKVTYTLKVTK